MKTKKEWDAREELAGNDLAVVTGGAKGVLIGAKKLVCPLCSKIYLSGSYCKEKACNKAALAEWKD